MDDFDYSLEALGVLNLFHDCEVVIYVEGQDDVCFWQNILDLAQVTDCYIESVNGSENLELKMEQIHSGAKIIVAMDKDTTLLNETFSAHPQIVTTYGYSIENHFYCPNIINSIANSFGKSNIKLVGAIERWFDDFSSSCHDLIIYNLANNIYKKGIEIFGNNCCRFLTSDKSCKISTHKVDHFITTVKSKFNTEEISACTERVIKFSGHNRYLIKGHFMSLAVINLIKILVRRLRGTTVAISLENLYALCINGCKMCNGMCSETMGLISSMKTAYGIASEQ